MTRPALIPTPMPVVLSTVSDLETALGKGHPLLVPARLAGLIFESTPELLPFQFGGDS